MNSRLTSLLAAFALGVSVPLTAGAANEHHHGEAGQATPQLQLDAGKKWATDQPLRQAMNEINQAMAKALPRIHHHRFEPADYQALADSIRQNVGAAVANCKLSPSADAMLHPVIAELIGGADSMASPTDSARHQGAVRVRDALQAYGKFFEHPGWKVARG